MVDNMTWYEATRSVPAEAKKPITVGRLKGMTDINPMWRIKKLTELFGACGYGWKEKNVHYEVLDGANGEKVVMCELEILYLNPENGSLCTVYGVGGSMLVVQEKNGLRTDDEAYKKAHTDAISVACKNLGMGADVYWNSDNTKYTSATDQKPIQQEQKADDLKTAEVGAMKISQIKIEALQKRCFDENVPVENIRSLYKVSNFAELTETKYRNICDNWEKIKAWKPQEN